MYYCNTASKIGPGVFVFAGGTYSGPYKVHVECYMYIQSIGGNHAKQGGTSPGPRVYMPRVALITKIITKKTIAT